MITAHNDDTIILWDGDVEHEIALADFDWVQPEGETPQDRAQTWLHLPSGNYDLTQSPIPPTVVTFPELLRPDRTMAVTFIPIAAYLRATYGPDNHFTTVPINGDAGAQRLHWRKRNATEQTQMRAVLEMLGAWRLTDEGEIPA